MAVSTSVAQTQPPREVARADSIAWCGAFETPRGSRLGVLAGFDLDILDLSMEAVRSERTIRLPARTFVFDFVQRAGEMIPFVASAEGLMAQDKGGEWSVVLPATDVFRGRLTSSPRRLEFAHADDRDGVVLVRPGVADILVDRFASGAVERIGAFVTESIADQKLGYGLGYTMMSRLTVPFFAFGSGEPVELLFRRGAELILGRTGTSGEDVWGRLPATRLNKIFGFPHAVPDLLDDWDGDSRRDLIAVDPGEGLLLAYRGAERPGDGSRGPDQAIRVSGHVLWRWLVDVDGDGRRDLLSLRVPPLNLLSQLGVVHSGKMPVVLACRQLREDGNFDEAPVWSEPFDLPVEVSITRSQKQVRFRAPVLPHRHGGEFRLLRPSAAGVAIVRRSASGFEVVHELSMSRLEERVVLDPFAPVLADFDGNGDLDLALRIDDRERSHQCVLVYHFE